MIVPLQPLGFTTGETTGTLCLSDDTTSVEAELWRCTCLSNNYLAWQIQMSVYHT